MSQFELNPSNLSGFFSNHCEQKLAYKIRKQPVVANDKSPFGKVQTEAGVQYELKVLDILGSDVLVNDEHKDKIWPTERFLSILRQEDEVVWKDDQYIFQPQLPLGDVDWLTLNIPEEYAKNVKPTNCRPDLLRIRFENGRRIIDVVDIKHTEKVKLSHRVQVYIYIQLLKRHVATIPNLEVDDQKGYIWLKGQNEATEIKFTGLDEVLDNLFKKLIPDIMDTNRVKRKLTEQCANCPYVVACTEESLQQRDVSILSSITDMLASDLFDEGIYTVEDFERYLQTPIAKAKYSEDAYRLHATTLEVFQNERAEVHRQQVHPYLPADRDLVLHLYADKDNSLGKATTLAYFIQGEATNFFDYFQKECQLSVLCIEHPRTFNLDLSGNWTHIERFFRSLHKVLVAINTWNRDAKQKIKVQFAFFKQAERSSFIQCLYELYALKDPTAPNLMWRQLIREFQSDRLLDAKVYPNRFQNNNLLSLDSIFKHFVIVPSTFTTDLFSIVEYIIAFDATLEQMMHDRVGAKLIKKACGDFIASKVNRSRLFDWWNDPTQTIALQEYHQIIKVRMLLMHRIESFLRSQYGEFLKYKLMDYRFCEEKALPVELAVKNETIHFFNHREQFINLREWYQAQFRLQISNPEEKNVILLECLDVEEVTSTRSNDIKYKFTLQNVYGKKIKNMTTYGVLVQTDVHQHGVFYDYLDWVVDHFNSRPSSRKWRWPKGESKNGFPLGKFDTFKTGEEQGTVTITLKKKHFKEGERYYLLPIFEIDSDELGKLESDLLHLNNRQWIDNLVHNQEMYSSRTTRFPFSVQKSFENRFGIDSFTDSKKNAYNSLLKYTVTAIWGPPGTGKTHFLSKVLSMLVLSVKQEIAIQEYRILIVAFTHAAIDNLLEAIMLEAESTFSIIPCRKVPGTKAPEKLLKISTQFYQKESKTGKVQNIGDPKFFESNDITITGMTYFEARKNTDEPKYDEFDFIVVDEASQLSISGFVAATKHLKPNGKIVLTGDHLQLGPIYQGVYPLQEGKLSPERSIFEHLMTITDSDGTVIQQGIPTVQLYENFRMNQCLTDLAAKLLYGEQYTPGSDATAQKRLSVKHSEKLGDFTEVINPEEPFVLMSPQTIGEPTDRWEAQMVAQLMVTVKHSCYPDIAIEEFFKEKLFVVSPHHKQIDLIKEEVSNLEPDWEPFVDTVDKMQGQEADVVLISYGLSSFADAMKESSFIYSRNRMNVSITRAKKKCILFLSQALFDVPATNQFDLELGPHYKYFIDLKEILEQDANKSAEEMNGHPTIIYRLSKVTM